MDRNDRQHKAELAIGKLLALGSLRELWTIEQLDQPPPHTREMWPDIERAARKRGEQPIPYRNLAREWMAACPQEWDEILRQSLERENLDHLPTAQEIVAAAMGSPLAQSQFRS